MYEYLNKACAREVTLNLADIEKIFTPDITFKINDSYMAKNSKELIEHIHVAIKPYKKMAFDPTGLVILAEPYVITSHYFNILNNDDSKERTMAINIFTIKDNRISDWTAVAGFANAEDKEIDNANFVHSLLNKK